MKHRTKHRKPFILETDQEAKKEIIQALKQQIQVLEIIISQGNKSKLF